MNKSLYILFFSFFIGNFTGFSQEELNLIATDTVETKINPLAPAKAAFYSALLPGLGQAYNKKYWKIPVVYAALGVGIYSYTWNKKQYNEYRDAYKERLVLGDNSKDPFPFLSDAKLIDAQKFHQKNKDLSLLITVVLYVLNIVDANVSAHLQQFNVNGKLTVRPDIKQNEFNYNQNVGLTFNYNFSNFNLMKIALLGYGKMGKVIERIALERGHEIVLRKSSTSTYEGLSNADVAIDFSIPDSAVCNISECFDTNIPIVCGTTGWLAHYDAMVDLCNEKNGSFIYGSNFSLGVNIFFELNNYLAKMMSNVAQYKVSIEEIHHTQKLDAPSGTAISLANGIIESRNLGANYSSWTLENPLENDSSDSERVKQIHIDAKRIENVPGTHSVFYDSEVDQIEIKHTAHSRDGFALGAVIAAEWLQDKKGVFTMRDVLSLNSK